jgi:hypothetical protein
MLREFPRTKTVSVCLHVDPPATETHTFEFKSRALFERRFFPEPDLTAGAYDAMPWNLVARFPQHLHHLAVMQRISRSGGNLGVGRDFSAGNTANRAAHRRRTLFAGF